MVKTESDFFARSVGLDQFSGWTMAPDIKETELGSSNQEASQSGSVISCAWNCVPTAISSAVDTLRSLGAICYNR